MQFVSARGRCIGSSTNFLRTPWVNAFDLRVIIIHIYVYSGKNTALECHVTRGDVLCIRNNIFTHCLQGACVRPPVWGGAQVWRQVPGGDYAAQGGTERSPSQGQDTRGGYDKPGAATSQCAAGRCVGDMCVYRCLLRVFQSGGLL